jgi:hypothetical protein
MARGNILLDILLMEGHQNLVVRYLDSFLRCPVASR